MEEQKKQGLAGFVILVIITAFICGFVICLFATGKIGNSDTNSTKIIAENKENVEKTTNKIKALSEYAITSNQLTAFDLSFLKNENAKVNKIYSPLSIKYALKMLEEGTKGEAKEQISSIIGQYTLPKYNSNSNMSFANAIFVNNNLKDEVNEAYINTIKSKYDAELKYDSFSNVNNINSWIKTKTLNLIDDMLQDINSEQQFLLINALAIDMDWNQKFLAKLGDYGYSWRYEHEDFYGRYTINVTENTFDDDQKVSGMRIEASINNYDIINELGEEKIRQTVSEEFRNKIQNENSWLVEDWLNNDTSEENIQAVLKKYFDGGKIGEYYETEGYIKEIAANYGRVDYSTDFSFYVDNDVKVFAKDLKKYDGVTLQYVGIMPINESLDSFIKSTNETEINKMIKNLKELKNSNFKQGVITKITGYIPKFDFEYELDLEKDLKSIGVTDIFEEGKANLSNITSDEKTYINEAVHKANIEFTQDGIKAAAATIVGGLGAGDAFDYFFEVPVEEIDVTFDKPYMFIIRDKDTGDVWFAGTVYEPLQWENETEKYTGNGKD